MDLNVEEIVNDPVQETVCIDIQGPMDEIDQLQALYETTDATLVQKQEAVKAMFTSEFEATGNELAVLNMDSEDEDGTIY